MKRAVWTAMGLGLCGLAQAQVDDPQSELRDIIEQRIEAVAEQLGSDNNIDLTVLTEMLLDFAQHPIDLNNTSIQELGQLQLLNDVQISALMEHERLHGPLVSLYELQTIDAFDPRTISLIRPFVKVRDNANATQASLKEILKNGSHEIMIRSQINIEQRAGFLGQANPFGVDYTDPDGDALPNVDDPQVLDSLRLNNRVYLGSPYKFYSRYRFRYRQNISFGVTAEKDEGEEFFRGSQPDGFDFYSAHLFVRNIGPLKALAIGDYQAQFGQGLTFWSGLAFGAKSAFTMNVKRNAAGLLPYASVNENLFLRGAAATVEVARHLEGTAFVSHKAIDANVADPDEPTAENVDQEAAFSSLLEDGFHRTTREVSRKDAATETIYGGHLRYKRRTWSIGATLAHAEFSARLDRDLRPYNQFEFEGRQNTTMGTDWNVLYRNLTWFGEVSRSANGGMAGNTGLLIALDKRLSLSMLYRDYRRDFQSLYSVAFAEGTNPWNERGLYTGIELKPDRKWTLNAYFDQFRFPWLRYLTNAPSGGYDVLAQLTWKPDRKTELYARVRHQDRQRNAEGVEEGIDPLVEVAQTNYRFNASYTVAEGVTLRTRVEAVDYQRGETPLEHGMLIYQDVIYRPMKSPWEFTGRVAAFGTDGYDARLYAYENDLIGLFSIPPYYGRGMRLYGMVRCTAVRGVDLWVRYGAWIYNDSTGNGSGLQAISGDRRSDLRVQVRWKF